MNIAYEEIKKGKIMYESSQYGNVLIKVISEPVIIDGFLTFDALCADGEDTDYFKKTYRIYTKNDKNYYRNPNLSTTPLYLKMPLDVNNLNLPWENFDKKNHKEFFLNES